MPGRRPKPTAVKIAEGNPGKRKLNKREPTPPPGAPDRPTHLRGQARDEWDRIVPQLLNLGVLSKVDRTALACYCESWGTYLKARGKIEREGEVVSGEVNPWLRIANEQKKLALRFLMEFGLTPATRSRLSVNTDKKSAADELKSFMETPMRIAQ